MTDSVFPLRVWWLAAVVLAACAQTPAMDRKETTMNTHPLTLWDTIEALAEQVPLTREKVELVLGTPLELKTRTEYLTHWVGDAVSLRDDVRVTQSSLALGPNDEFDDTSGITLHLAGACVTLAQVKAHHGAITIIDAPRGHSDQEATVHATKEPWGHLRFAFIEANPDCLESVTLAATEKPYPATP